MKPSLGQIKEATWGAARIIEEGDCLCFYRCTKEQEELFRRRKEEFYRHSLGTAGVRLVFKTNSTFLKLNVKVENTSERKRFSFDIFVNGNLIGYLDNFSNVELPVGEKWIDLPIGEFEKKFDLGQGDKEICIHFPYSVKAMLDCLEIEEGSSFEPIRSKKKMLAYGDSITQGYYALRPSERYISRLADLLGAEEVNKAIGSDRFCPDLAYLTDEFLPDYIVIAHGTNDWRTNRTVEEFKEKSGAFIYKIREQYPTAHVIVVSPIWRKDYADERPFGDFTKIDDALRDVVENMQHVTVVRGFDLIPHEEKYYGDFLVHPNDEGFREYFDSMKQQMKF